MGKRGTTTASAQTCAKPAAPAAWWRRPAVWPVQAAKDDQPEPVFGGTPLQLVDDGSWRAPSFSRMRWGNWVSSSSSGTGEVETWYGSPVLRLTQLALDGGQGGTPAALVQKIDARRPAPAAP